MLVVKNEPFREESARKAVDTAVRALQEKSGKNIFAVDLRGVSSMCDYCIVAEGNVDRHLRALARAVEEDLALAGLKPSFVEGLQEGSWVVMDYLRIVIHLFLPETREKYRLERLWEEGTLVESSPVDSETECPLR